MNKSINIIRKFFFKVLIFSIFFIVIGSIISNLFSIKFRLWLRALCIMSTLLSCSTLLILSTAKKSITIFLSVFLFIINIIVLFSILTFHPEHMITENSQKYIIVVRAFSEVNIDYYQYQNIFFYQDNLLKTIYYDDGCYDPYK